MSTVIEDLELAASPERVMAMLTTSRPGWRVRGTSIVLSFDVVGEHVTARFKIETRAPTLLALICESENGELGWAKTRITIAVARTSVGARIALIHPGRTGSATREVWTRFLAELADEAVARAA